VIGALLGGATGDLATITLAAVGGVTALLSHLVKAGLRLAINTSPEPASNIGASLVGDLGVVSLTTLAVLFPIVAAAIAALLLVLGTVLTIMAMSRVRRGYQAFRRWLARND
jgi:hypothetical protein